jgi:hypothetical protein
MKHENFVTINGLQNVTIHNKSCCFPSYENNSHKNNFAVHKQPKGKEVVNPMFLINDKSNHFKCNLFFFGQ